MTATAILVLLGALAVPASAKLTAPTSKERHAICLGQQACDTAGGDFTVRVYVSTRTDRHWALIEHLVAKPGLMGTYVAAAHKTAGGRWRTVAEAGTGALDLFCAGRLSLPGERDLPPAFRRDLAARPYC